jgi:predicted negative regulator of RcsB-dependent stress response
MIRGNLLFLVIGILVVIASVLGYQVYQDRKQPQGVEILLGPKGVSIENK